MDENEDIKQLHLGNHANSTNSVQNMAYFSLSCEHNIETYDIFRAELVEIAQFFSIITNFSVHAMYS